MPKKAKTAAEVKKDEKRKKLDDQIVALTKGVKKAEGQIKKDTKKMFALQAKLVKI
jgi:hypothetical protein